MLLLEYFELIHGQSPFLELLNSDQSLIAGHRSAGKKLSTSPPEHISRQLEDFLEL